MNVTSKLDLDGMLNDWPAPAGDDAAWEARAARTVEVALSRRSEDAVAQADLLAAPDLPAEPGEEQAGDALREVHAAGDSTMGDGSQARRAAASEASPSSGGASRPPEKRRQSLKEIAERASQAPGRVSGVPGSGGAALSTPLPSGRSSLSTPLPSSGRVSTPPGRGALHNSGIRTSPPSLRSAEGVTEDSGVIDLNRLSASVPPEHVEVGEKAQPGAAGALDDERPAEVAALSARRPRASTASGADVSAKRRSGGLIAGAALAAVGLAAAVAVLVQTPKAPPQQETAAAPPPAETLAAPPEVKKEAEPAAPAPVAAAPAAKEETAPAEQPQPVKAEEKVVVAQKAPAAAPAAGAGAAARATPEAPAAPVAPAAEPEGKVAAAPTVTEKPGDLPSAMQAAVGGDGESQPSVVSEAPVPASGPLRNQQNIPEQPSQGSVQAALGAVMSNARSCVAGADDVSRAQITFSSTGQVSKVNVSGWAAANGQSGCVQSALKAANVGPFSRPSFTVGATIRP
ncbi:hypothetical protein [Sorangium sp. So ce513]|uniref:hypothetical protein n=1 Tax=Sorangium sp. So ce513 TaxID=3133315 RepID=UPI003F5F082E